MQEGDRAAQELRLEAAQTAYLEALSVATAAVEKAETRIALADSIAESVALAETALGTREEAVVLYQEALKEIETALPGVDQALADRLRNAAAFNLGITWLELGMPAKALEQLDPMQPRVPEKYRAQLQYNRAMALEQLGRAHQGQAFVAYLAAIQLDPNYSEPIAGATRIALQEAVVFFPSQVARLADHLVRVGKLAPAETLLQRAFKLDGSEGREVSGELVLSLIRFLASARVSVGIFAEKWWPLLKHRSRSVDEIAALGSLYTGDLSFDRVPDVLWHDFFRWRSPDLRPYLSELLKGVGDDYLREEYLESALARYALAWEWDPEHSEALHHLIHLLGFSHQTLDPDGRRLEGVMDQLHRRAGGLGRDVDAHILAGAAVQERLRAGDIETAWKAAQYFEQARRIARLQDPGSRPPSFDLDRRLGEAYTAAGAKVRAAEAFARAESGYLLAGSSDRSEMVAGQLAALGEISPLEQREDLPEWFRIKPPEDLGVTDETVVVAEAPLVNVFKHQAGQEITLELTESLPTARSYQEYLQLVPGVQDDIDSSNPASRSGINYTDRLGVVGQSTDNLYYFDGINVSDRSTGTFGAELNTEIIQEQSVLTGAIPAEYAGAPGLISNVVTKSGGNQFSGSLNYYFQDDSLVEKNRHFEDEVFSTFDTAFTLGGPVKEDRAWFFTSLRLVERNQDTVDENDFNLRSPTRSSEQGFAKLTWAITGADVISGTFLTDPQESDGSFSSTVPNLADSASELGGERYVVGYNRVWGAAALEASSSRHQTDSTDVPLNERPGNVISFRPGDVFSSAEERLGGAGSESSIDRSNTLNRASVEYLFDTGFGDHAFKIGFEFGDSDQVEDRSIVGNAFWTSISARELGGSVMLGEILGQGDADPFSTVEFGLAPEDFQGFRDHLSSENQAVLLGLWDLNNDGWLSDQEILDHMAFASILGNPDGQINYVRELQTSGGRKIASSDVWQGYIQDSWQWNKWSVNLGLRAEKTSYSDPAGETISDFDPTLAPRISIAYDLRGDGRSFLSLFWGQYYDAIRDNVAEFAESLEGQRIEHQIWTEELQQFVTYRVRGGQTQLDGFIAPRIETPVTREIQLQYRQELAKNSMFELNLIDRETSDIMEDFASLYYDESVYVTLGGDLNHPDRFFLGSSYFGFTGSMDVPADLNALIGTLPPEAFRDWRGVELFFRKRYSDHWQMLASYNYADADANTNSDSNTDGAGNILALDPRAPNREGVQPGLVKHLFKVSGSYNWDNGFMVGASYRWNSGAILNRSSTVVSSEHLLDQLSQGFPANGFSGEGPFDTWIAEDSIGFIDGSKYGTLDARVSYLWSLTDRVELDFFLDVFNVLDDQQTIRVQDLKNGGSGFQFLEGIDFVSPRRYFLGARLRF